MPRSAVDEILERLHALQEDLEAEIDHLLDERRAQFRYRLVRGRVRFEEGVKALQERQRMGLWAYPRDARLGQLLSAPVIYSVLLPLALLDAAITAYQYICFRVYGIPQVRRGEYLVVDRQHLAYLNAIERLNCMYCGYANGLVAYAREITARTERYWCPIKHARRTPAPHRCVDRFVDYGDAEAYRARLEALRREVTELRGKASERPIPYR
jgi:hypothetical protein